MDDNNKMTTTVKSQDSVSALQSMCYALPIIPSVMLLSPMAIIQGIYAKHYGIALSTLAAIIMISRILDAISDPIIGYYSDRHRQKHGTRKPFITFGGISLIVCGYFLYAPTGTVTSTYFAFWSITFYIVYTCFEIPHITWPNDIVHKSEEKAKLYSYRMVAGYLGMALFYCIPLLPFFESDEITPKTLQVTFAAAAIVGLPFLFFAIIYMPAGTRPLPNDPSVPYSKWQLFREIAAELKSNKPFLIFILAFLFGSFSVGMWYGLIYIYVDVYLGMGEQFAKIFLIAFLVGILVTPIWYRLALKFGKIKTWTFSMGLMVISFIYTGTLDPGETLLTHLLILKITQTCSFVCSGVVAPSMLSDIIDYSRWKFKTEKSATYFSMQVFFAKTSGALGAALALAIVGWCGFEMSASEHPGDSILGLKMAIAWIPTLLTMIAIIFLVLSPIDERRHRIIRKRLDARLIRKSSTISNISKSDNETLGIQGLSVPQLQPD